VLTIDCTGQVSAINARATQFSDCIPRLLTLRAPLTPAAQEAPLADEQPTSVLAMAHALNLEVVTEGVEWEESASFLTAMRCDVLQGYYFRKPLPAAALESWLYKNQAAYASPVRA
jgi:predicted signal transduction protein with EAL and GGDEF domain